MTLWVSPEWWMPVLHRWLSQVSRKLRWPSPARDLLCGRCRVFRQSGVVDAVGSEFCERAVTMMPDPQTVRVGDDRQRISSRRSGRKRCPVDNPSDLFGSRIEKRRYGLGLVDNPDVAAREEDVSGAQCQVRRLQYWSWALPQRHADRDTTAHALGPVRVRRVADQRLADLPSLIRNQTAEAISFATRHVLHHKSLHRHEIHSYWDP